jgi:hypothetical protein
MQTKKLINFCKINLNFFSRPISSMPSLPSLPSLPATSERIDEKPQCGCGWRQEAEEDGWFVKR